MIIAQKFITKVYAAGRGRSETNKDEQIRFAWIFNAFYLQSRSGRVVSSKKRFPCVPIPFRNEMMTEA